MDEREIAEFWQNHPCGDEQVGGLIAGYTSDYEAFFRAYDAFRYQREAHILKCLNRIDFKAKRVLEIGLGEGADSEQIIRRGARWSGLDLTPASVARVRTRLELRRLPFEDIKQGSALDIPFPTGSFDMVFAHGVLHHIPEIQTAQDEIARVLRPGGELIMMVYAKWSFNYLIAIGIVRRLGLASAYYGNLKLDGIYSDHLRNAKEYGIWDYLKMRNFIHRNTDGPSNPYSKVYDIAEIRSDFAKFRVVRSYKRWMHGPPLPVSWLPLGPFLGWHLWVHLRPVADIKS